MFNYISSCFRSTPQNIVQSTIEEYERALITAETQALMSNKMVEFYKDAIAKLNTYKA